MKIQRHVCQKFSIPHYNGVTWVSWHLKSPATLWFVQHFVWAYIEGNMKAWLTDPLWTESTCDGLFVRRIQCWLVDFLHKGPVMQNLLWGHRALSLYIYIYDMWRYIWRVFGKHVCGLSQMRTQGINQCRDMWYTEHVLAIAAMFDILY